RRAPVVVALAELRADGCVPAAGSTTRPPLRAGADPFVRAVHAYCGGRSAYTVNEIGVALADELDALEERVAARGYLRSATDRWRMRLGAAPVTAAAVGGAATAFIRMVLADSAADIRILP
ncbi:hypothetical protein, partial [Tsukamurella paurometabola]